jgi:hypothetical protein
MTKPIALMTTLQHGRSSYGNRSNGPNIPMCCVTSLPVIFVGRPTVKAKPVVRVLILDEALLKNKMKGLEDHRIEAYAFTDSRDAIRHLSKRPGATA